MFILHQRANLNARLTASTTNVARWLQTPISWSGDGPGEMDGALLSFQSEEKSCLGNRIGVFGEEQQRRICKHWDSLNIIQLSDGSRKRQGSYGLGGNKTLSNRNWNYFPQSSAMGVTAVANLTIFRNNHPQAPMCTHPRPFA